MTLIAYPIHLIVQYYRATTPERQVEIDTCLRENLLNNHITAVHLLTEKQFDLTGFPNAEKAQQTVIGERLTYELAFRHANDCPEPVIWLLANADIYFDDTLRFLINADLTNTVYALTRHDIQRDGRIRLVTDEHAHGCQDAWVFTASIPLKRLFTSFYLGIPGCDNRIVYELISKGYNVINPSLTITARHLDLCRVMETGKRADAYFHMNNPRSIAAGKVAPPPYLGEIYPTHNLKATDAVTWDHHRAVLMDFAKHVSYIDEMQNSYSWKLTAPLRRMIAMLLPHNSLRLKIAKRLVKMFVR